MEEIADVLAQRYATKPIRDIWSARGKIVLEREFWIAVMRAQRDLGLDIPEEAIEAYERVKNDVDTASINARERVTRHDVKARIEEFCALAGCEHIHKGMTSRDLTESVEQLQVFRSLEHIRLKTVAAIRRLAERAAETRDVAITARTHNVAAQLTTLGKRFAMFGEDLLVAFRELEALIANYPARGVKGAVGTQLDLLTLFDHDLAKVAEFDARVRRHLGIPHAFNATGQVYPRSLDFATVATLVHVGAGASSFAKTLRLMAGHELAGEGFLPGQVGSSAMPHKMNSRSCERLNGLHVILKGYLSMTAALAGDQWNEGDVSCSVVRRVALPDSFFAIDALLETFLVILNQMEINVPVIEREKDDHDGGRQARRRARNRARSHQGARRRRLARSAAGQDFPQRSVRPPRGGRAAEAFPRGFRRDLRRGLRRDGNGRHADGRVRRRGAGAFREISGGGGNPSRRDFVTFSRSGL